MRRLTVFGFFSLFLSTAASAQTDSKGSISFGSQGLFGGAHTSASGKGFSNSRYFAWHGAGRRGGFSPRQDYWLARAERLPADAIFRQCADQLSGFDWRGGPVLNNGSPTAALRTSRDPALQRRSDAETHVYECDDRCGGDAGVRASGVCGEAGTEESGGVSRSGSGSA